MEAYKWDEAIGHFSKAMEHAAGTELVALSSLVGLCHYAPGRSKEALESHEKSARLAEQYGDKQGKAVALDNVGVIWRDNVLWKGADKALLDKAHENHETALKMLRELGAKTEEASALTNIGGIHFLKGEPDKALAYFEDALKIYQETGDRQGQAGMLGNIGIAHEQKGELDKALEYVERAVKLSREIGSKKLLADNLCNVGTMYSAKGDLGKALACGEEAAKLCHEMGAMEEVGALANVGHVLVQKGEHERAVGSFMAAREVVLARGGVPEPRLHREGLGKCLEALGREKFVAACEKAGMPKPEAEKLADQLLAEAKK
jgi:tetratricopeptide (TPR) repeat protein